MIFWIISEREKNFTLTIFFFFFFFFFFLFFFLFFCFTFRSGGRSLSLLCMSLLLRNGAIKCFISSYKLDLMRPPRNGPACASALSAQRLCCSLCIPSEFSEFLLVIRLMTFINQEWMSLDILRILYQNMWLLLMLTTPKCFILKVIFVQRGYSMYIRKAQYVLALLRKEILFLDEWRWPR